MKKTFLSLTLFCLLTTLFAQTWAPTGAKWWYLSYSLSLGQYYASIESTGDTIIQGKNCKVLQSNGIGGCTYGSEIHPIFIYSDTNKVFYFSQNQNKFCLLYDFNKLPGDTLYIKTGYGFPSPDSVGFVIDSVGFTTICTTILKVQYVTALFDPLCSWVGNSGKIIERIGHSSFLFPLDLGACDDAWTNGGILCYTDSAISYYDSNYSSSFCATIGIEDKNSNNALIVYPNPTKRFITITKDKDLINQINIYDVYGRCILRDYKSNFLNLSGLTNGIYFLEIMTDNNIKTRIKIIKSG
ncbi:MAG TPA: T9SS type A sorting domain-containing protein [Bacteroidales bacterium]|nr:T9SS type A sorting domain-containing protein [Bacteroidales bacterium]